MGKKIKAPVIEKEMFEKEGRGKELRTSLSNL